MSKRDADLLVAARPSCPVKSCNTKIVRVEQRWIQDAEGEWKLVVHKICELGHRSRVEPL